MNQPLDINALARETVAKLGMPEGGMPFRVVLSALTKLAAEKDAEILAATRERNENYDLMCEMRTIRDDVLADLARHKAALKVATDALNNAPHDRGVCLKGDASFYCTCWKKNALQKIDKLLNP